MTPFAAGTLLNVTRPRTVKPSSKLISSGCAAPFSTTNGFGLECRSLPMMPACAVRLPSGTPRSVNAPVASVCADALEPPPETLT